MQGLEWVYDIALVTGNTDYEVLLVVPEVAKDHTDREDYVSNPATLYSVFNTQAPQIVGPGGTLCVLVLSHGNTNSIVNYDNNGNVLKTKDRRGVTVTNSYNKSDMLVEADTGDIEIVSLHTHLGPASVTETEDSTEIIKRESGNRSVVISKPRYNFISSHTARRTFVTLITSFMFSKFM